MATYVELFAWKGERINPNTADRIGRELGDRIRGHEDGKVVAMVELGTLALGCMETFGWSQAECRRRMFVNHNRMSYAVQLAGRIGRNDGGLDEDKVAPLRYADGSLPSLTTILRHFGIRPPAKPKPSKPAPNKASAHADARPSGTPHGMAPAGSASGQARTQWRHGGDEHTEHRDGTATPRGADPARSASLSSSRSGPAGGRHHDAGTHGHGPEPVAAGRVSTHAQRARVGREPMAAPHGVGTPGGQQLTMDALYAGAIDGAERLLAELGELVEKDGLDAALVMAAREHIGDGLEMLRAAGGGGNKGKNDTARRGKTPHGVPSGTTGASRAG